MKSKLLFVTSKDPNAGSLIVTIGLMQLLKSRYKRVAFFRPIIKETSTKDPDIVLMRSHFDLDQPYDSCYALTLSEAKTAILSDRESDIYKKVIAVYKELEEHYDFIICEGVSQQDLALSLDFDINIEVAKNLSAPVVGVINGYEKPLPMLKEEMELWELSLREQGIELFAIFLNRLYQSSRNEKIKNYFSDCTIETFFIDEIEELNEPTVKTLSSALNAEHLYGNAASLLRNIKGYRIAAMQTEHFLERLEDGDLVIVPSDRIDIILAVLMANSAKNLPCASGILLTGGFVLPPYCRDLLDGLEDQTLPIIAVELDTMSTANEVIDVPARITHEDRRKIALILGLFYEAVPLERVIDRLSQSTPDIRTPSMFTYQIFEMARKQKARIVLPESLDERILRASEEITKQHIAEIVLLGSADTIHHKADQIGVNLDGIDIIDPNDDARLKQFSQKLYTLRAHKGMTLDSAYDNLHHPNYFATMLVEEGLVDGMVSGAIHTTRETIKPAFQIIGTQPHVKLVSSLFFMCLDTKVLVYADCAIVPDPSAEELAHIAISSAKTAEAFGIDPVVAMLSYSTGHSGVGEDVKKVERATALVKEMDPTLPVEGPIQYDAAIDLNVGTLKLPDSKVAGHANVFIFPDLNTGNNTYKAVQRSTDAIAIGPILQGLKSPVNDLSRGCSVDDIVSTVAITAAMSRRS